MNREPHMTPTLRAYALAIALVAVTAAAAASFAAPAQAQNYPWCLISSAYEGGENCGFDTNEQCQASRLGIGGFCQVNTQYRASGAPAPRRTLKTHPGKPS
jgi:uncharacterized low-complexity protein